MGTPSSPVRAPRRHAGPHLGALALVFAALQLAGIYPVSVLAGGPSSSFPAPTASPAAVATYLQTHATAVLICAVLQAGAVVPLGIFTAAAVSRLRFLGVRAAGADIALFGGFLAAVGSAASASVLWVLAHAGVARDAALGPALFYLQFAFGGPGYTVPLGVLLAGLSVPAGFGKLLPRWIVGVGLVLAAVGVLSWISLALPDALFLIPLTRFPAFVWLIAAGFALPRTAPRSAPSVR